MSNTIGVRKWYRRTKLKSVKHLGGKCVICCYDKCINALEFHHRNRTLLTIEYKGGSCSLCGFDKCAMAFEFHHTDQAKKEFNISKTPSLKWDNIKIELDKCVMLCANCHRETHAGITAYSSQKDIDNKYMSAILEEPLKTKNKINNCVCGVKILKSSKRCKKCHGLELLKMVSYDKEELTKLINNGYSLVKIGKIFGVSDKHIKKRVIEWNIPYTTFKYVVY